MAINLVEGMFKTLETALTEQVASNFESLYTVVFPIWSVGLILYYVIVAWEIIYGDKQIVINEFITKFMVLAVISTFLGASAIYTSNVVPFVMNSGQEIAGKIIADGAGSGSTGAMIDSMISSVIDLGKKEYAVVEDSGIFDSVGIAIMFGIKCLILFVTAGAFIIYSAAYLIMAMVMVGILLSLGGVFIMFAAFPSTRQMFTSWVGSCLNYIFLNISYAILFSVLIKYLDKFMQINSGNGGDDNNLWVIAMIGLSFAIGCFLLQQVAVLVSQLTGGVGINGLVNSVNGFAKQGLKAAGFAGRGAGKVAGGIGNAAVKAREKMWDMGGKLKGG